MPARTMFPMDMSTQEILAHNVRAARKRSGLSKSKFCLMLGISRPVLNAIEDAEQNIKLQTLDRLAVGIGVEPWELLKID